MSHFPLLGNLNTLSNTLSDVLYPIQYPIRYPIRYAIRYPIRYPIQYDGWMASWLSMDGCLAVGRTADGSDGGRADGGRAGCVPKARSVASGKAARQRTAAEGPGPHLQGVPVLQTRDLLTIVHLLPRKAGGCDAAPLLALFAAGETAKAAGADAWALCWN